MKTLTRREFLYTSGISAGAFILTCSKPSWASTFSFIETPVEIFTPKSREDVFSYINRIKGGFDLTLYRQIAGSANHFKEGDAAQGVAAFDDNSRNNARILLANTGIKDLAETPLYADGILTLINDSTDKQIQDTIGHLTLGELKAYILDKPEAEIKKIMPGLTSDIIALLVRLMSNEELISVGSKVFNPLPGSMLGAKGYMAARVQPNSPTDNPDDIRMQVFNGWSYAVGDMLLGTNPVSSDPESVAEIELVLHDILVTFGLEKAMPHSVLAHVDVQAMVEEKHSGKTGIWFQSLGGTESANETFDITIDKMLKHVSGRTCQFGLYVETGQGADFTNGHGEGFDMVVHESRKYGFVRALKKRIAEVQSEEQPGPWVHVNDVAGFIGPEVFRNREQLVRCCLEDTVMGKLHGLTIGLDICSTLHMDVTLDDLTWCIDQIMPVNPAYLMALPTKNDPMLSYLTTGFYDHVRVREKFGYKVNDAMWEFFKRMEIIDKDGNITKHFGDPVWVYYKYRLAKGDIRSIEEIYNEGNNLIADIENRGVPISRGFGSNYWDPEPVLDKKIHALYEDSKACIWRELTASFIASIPGFVLIETTSADRKDYIYHPPTGEVLSANSIEKLHKMRARWRNNIPDVQIIISDGLNVSALSDENHLKPFLEHLRKELTMAGLTAGADHIVIRNGRVRAGYRCGEYLFGYDAGIKKRQNSDATADNKNAENLHKGIIHIIGERPGSEHHNFSAYLSAPLISTWKVKGKLDHNISKVVSGISDTALTPELAAKEVVRLLKEMFNTGKTSKIL